MTRKIEWPLTGECRFCGETFPFPVVLNHPDCQAAPTAPEAGLREAVEALAAEYATKCEVGPTGKGCVPNRAGEKRHSHDCGVTAKSVAEVLRHLLATQPTPVPGVAETVETVLSEHGYRGYYGCRCEAVDGLGLPTGAAGKWHRAHVAAVVARALGGAS